MSLTYIGNCEWEEMSGAQLDIDDYGLDRLVRPYMGRADKLGDFIKQFAKGTPDSEFKPLSLIRRPAQDAGNGMWTLNAEFVGKFDGVEPEARRSGSIREHSVTLTREGFEDSIELQYLGPTTTYRYAIQTEPKKRKFAGRLILPDEAWQIRRMTGATEHRMREATGVSINQGPISVSGFYNYVRIIIGRMSFEENGQWWEITEENEGLIVPVDRLTLQTVLDSGDVASAQEEE